MSKSMRGALFGALLVALLVAAGCSSGDEFAVTIDGQYVWTIGSFGCPILVGILTAQQTFTVNQNGNDIDWSFTDTNGNQVTFTGTYDVHRLTGMLTVLDLLNRRIEATIDMVSKIVNGLRTLDGTIDITFDSDGLCAGTRAGNWMIETGVPGSFEDVIEQCPPADIVIVMDTSGSMRDDAEALCSQIDGIVANLAALGLEDFRVFKWGITEDIDNADEEFSCLTDNVRDLFNNPEVPGLPGRFLDFGDSDEDWGPSIAIISHLGSAGRSPAFQWREGALRIIVAISDEGPSNGDPPVPDPEDVESGDEPDDAVETQNAITVANANNVICSVIIGSGQRPAGSEFAAQIATGTGGVAIKTADPNLDIASVINDIIFVSCGGTLQPQPALPCFSGPTILVAARKAGGIYRLDPTGATQPPDTFLAPTPLAAVLTQQELDGISSMVYNEKTSELWASTGNNSVDSAATYRIAGNGTSTILADNSDETDGGLPSMAQRCSDRSIFGMEGDDDLLLYNNMTGDASEHTDKVDDATGFNIAEQGNGVTFVGDILYLASGTELFTLDTFSGRATKAADLTLSNFNGIPSPVKIASMTTRPSDNAVFGLLKAGEGIGAEVYLVSINVSTGVVTNIGRTSVSLDGITWVPVGYFIGD